MSLPAVSKTIVGALFVLFAITAVGLETSSAEDTDREQIIRRWVRQLDANQFAARQEAAEELTKLGKDAIPAIENAALTGTGEVASRSVDLLKNFAGSPDEETSTLALSSLRRLAASGNQTAGYIAKEAIEQLKRKLGPHRIAEDAPQQPPIMPAGNFNRSVRISNNGNGEKTIDVTENGQRVVARTSANGHVCVTFHLPNGKQETVEAESVDKLREKDAAAFAKLEELTKIVDAGPRRLPQMENMPRVHVRVPRAREGVDPFAEMDQQIEAMRARHEQFLNDMQQNMRVRRLDADVRVNRNAVSDEQLKEVRERLSATLKRIEQAEANDIDSVDLQRLDDALKRIESTLDAS
ncbi:hypothetical protein ACYFX5_10425 [Bremerella sp. T1]|uniref:hypothetical protein n=1 Tax=Bremerella sp. TYQ1 TaxID=3119568 RepID=UPI001CCF4C96|nr:hypothetical protein [Bremerella volcania]UBM38664.1 hypothetical protein LA756_12370 [Bremerella volcania]